MKPKVVIESHVPEIPAVASEYFDIARLDPEEIDADAVKDADALIVRTRTKCNHALLDGSKVSFVGTATIGTDHIDLPYCKSRGITAVSAPGCNAPAVAQYVFASLLTLFPEGLAGKSIAVVGVGHVGSIVARWSEQLGMRLFKCDPPRRDAENDESFIQLKEAAQKADIVTFHVPFTREGSYPTFHMGDKAFFDTLKPCAVVINSARGGVIDTSALLSAMDDGKVGHAVIDCWEGEPSINVELLSRASVATPHIAGYSLAGKIRATSMVMEALCRHFNIPKADTDRLLRSIPQVAPGAAATVSEDAIRNSYDPTADTMRLRSGLKADGTFDSALFERLRNSYHLRAEVASPIQPV